MATIPGNVDTTDLNMVFQGLKRHLEARGCDVSTRFERVSDGSRLEHMWVNAYVRLLNANVTVFLGFVNTEPNIVYVERFLQNHERGKLRLDLNDPETDVLEVCEDWLFNRT